MSFNRALITLTSLVIVLGSVRVGRGQASVDISNRIRAAMETRDWKTARSEVERLNSADPSMFRARSYDYLLGRLAEESADFTSATKSYEAAISNNSPLSAYALWHLARMARGTGDLVLEREHLRKVVSLSPDSLLYDASNLRLAESFFESEDYTAAAATARQVGSSKNIVVAREGRVLLGRALLKNNKLAEAQDVFKTVVMQMPDASRPDDFALVAVSELDELEKQSKPPLTEADHLLRASVYQFNRDFVGARIHYQAVIDSNPRSGAIPNALYQIGRGLYLEGKYDEAIKTLQRVVDQFGQSQSARDSLSSLAASYLRLKRTDDAIAAYKSFINRFPDAPNLERPYLNIIDALHESGRYAEALNWIQQTRSRFPNQLGAALALFAQQRIHLAQSAWTDVVRDADELLKISDLGGVKVGGGTTSTEVAFLKAFALEQLGRTEEAINSYQSIPDGRNEYYGNRATQRLLNLANNDKSRPFVINAFNLFATAAKTANDQNQFEQARTTAQSALRLTNDQQRRSDLLDILRRAYDSIPSYKLQRFQLVPVASPDPTANPGDNGASNPAQLGSQLFELGLYDEAMPEIFKARATSVKTQISLSSALSAYDYSLAAYSLRGGLANRAVRFGEQFWKTVPPDYVLEVAPRELVELLYPVPFRDALLKHAASRNVDPRFVLSIIRQESRYKVDVKSVSAARGMMQFIPATANDIAVQLKLKDFTQDDLYSPDTAILFGSQYLANLFQQFPNQPQAVAGSYNGGADNLARWIGRSKSNEADRYVPEIGFNQTKDYVYKVIANYWNYQRLYDDKLQPVTK
ncbi:MAG TPA: transglycosylase SLT domain-containing protein [Pyrinomonadaceae bacterium]|nr:transglycosylase SLT domain-containing protein [Pyrinomonadaceae bacterium]